MPSRKAEIKEVKETVMSDPSNAVAIYESHTQAEAALQKLSGASFDIKKISIIGKGYHTEENVVGYYTTGDRMKHWGKTGAFWGGLWGLLAGSAFFLIPGIGPIMVAGSAVAWIVSGLEGAIVVGGLSALGAGLYSKGFSKGTALKYESSVKAGKYLLIAHGTPEEAEAARRILGGTDAEEINVHEPDRSVAAA